MASGLVWQLLDSHNHKWLYSFTLPSEVQLTSLLECSIMLVGFTANNFLSYIYSLSNEKVFFVLYVHSDISLCKHTFGKWWSIFISIGDMRRDLLCRVWNIYFSSSQPFSTLPYKEEASNVEQALQNWLTQDCYLTSVYCRHHEVSSPGRTETAEVLAAECCLNLSFM